MTIEINGWIGYGIGVILATLAAVIFILGIIWLINWIIIEILFKKLLTYFGVYKIFATWLLHRKGEKKRLLSEMIIKNKAQKFIEAYTQGVTREYNQHLSTGFEYGYKEAIKDIIHE